MYKDHITTRRQLSSDMYYKYEELYSRPFITPGSDIPENLLNLSHSFGYDCQRRENLQLLDDRTLIFIAGQLIILLDVSTKQQRYLRSCSGGGIGSIGVHPSKDHFAVAEKGNKPLLIVYEYPSLQAYRILRDGTERAFSSVNFNSDGSLLASLGSAPDYMLTVWNWRQEEVMLRCKAISQEVYRVSFSPYNPGLLTSSGSGHIKFWKMANTFTGLKLEGLIGHFGKTAATDIEGYIELPDGKVVSGSNWGNLLLWDGNAIKVELCSKGGQCCHAGVVKPFALEDGQLLTFGSDGVIRGWDFETIVTAEGSCGSSKFEVEPMNELVVGHHVCLSSIVKSSQPDSNVWFAQDSTGAIWKLDLSFKYTTPDPECLFSFHVGPIKGLDVSKKSHLMATTSLDRSVRVFDFLAKTELTCSRFSQGGTALHWAPPVVSQTGSLLVTGFEDGVVRLLELFDPKGVHSYKGGAQLRLKQAFKPHNAPVTAVAYECSGKILATGSSDRTVFFFTVGETYEPIGFVSVPGPVEVLEWSPHSHNDNRLLILCQSGHITEVPCPDPKALKLTKSYELLELPRRSFYFKSVKSRIKREDGIARRQAVKEKRQDEGKEITQEEEGEKKEEELPSIYIPDPPSPLHWGFYSKPGQFWLSMGGFDAGFLYHCKFSDNQDEDPDQRQDEPFDFLVIHNADDDSICSVTFSSNRQLMLCGMHSGSIRVYPLDPDDHSLTSMQAYWELSVHDSIYGHLRNICCSHDDHFVLTAGDDGNIFSFSLLPLEELQKTFQRKRATVPSPRVDLENEELAQDIDDPAANSLEMAKQKLEKDRLCREAERKKSDKRKKLSEIQDMFKKLLKENQELPGHIRLTPTELQLDPRFAELAEIEKAGKLKEVQDQMSWEEEHSRIALNKLQKWFNGSPESDVLTVFAIHTGHKVSTYNIPELSSVHIQQQCRSTESSGKETAQGERRKSKDQPVKGSSEIDEEDVPHTLVTHSSGVKLADRQIERLQKAAEKAKQAQAKIEKRKQEWDKLYAEKPKKNCEDPRDVQAICEAKENIGDLKLKTDKDFTVPKHLRMSADRKKAEIKDLEDNIREKQTEMNREIWALRDCKLHLVAKLQVQAQQLQRVQKLLPSHLHRHPPPLPTIRPEEIPDKRQRCSPAILDRYRVLREQRSQCTELKDPEVGLLKQLEEEVEGLEEAEEMGKYSSVAIEEEEEEEPTEEQEAQLSEENKQSKLLHIQDSILEKMERLVHQFDKEHLMCLNKVEKLEWMLKLGNLRQLTLFQELLLLKEVDKNEKTLQEKLNIRLKEENNLMSKLEESQEELELKHKDIAKVQEREKAVSKAFRASLGDDKKFEEYLFKVFKKKIKRIKKKERVGDEENENDSGEDFDDYENWDDDEEDWDTPEGEAAVEECPPDCDPKLFEHILQLRERRLDLEERLAEEKKSADVLERECDTLIKKLKSVQISRKAAEDDLEQVNREKQQQMNQLDVVVPLRLHQIEFDVNGPVPSDMSSALVLTRTELQRLQERVNQLEAEKRQQTEVYSQARQQYTRLVQERKDMSAEIQSLEKLCNQLMMRRFGREVDLEVLQTLSGNRMVEELKQQKLLQEAANAKEIKEWDIKVQKAREVLMRMTRSNTERLLCLNSLFEQKKELEQKLDARQKKIEKQLQDFSRQSDRNEVWRLQELVRKQAQQVEALSREISFLSRKGGHVLLSSHNQLPPLVPWTKPTVQTHTKEAGGLHSNKRDGKAWN
ncbi:cilia- and flagella-associated protein 44-like [Dunckerocampus dactyliophorus]|uniref:cilia- and flagella-associated protein 44-like n=1 Tax=Dunckerocampus dactyliophorus TaxID=161453 RepID=UPI002404FF21|nr:cilia- and flagella-associated protein 44-like [Dunckerocampus dactyliophorus]